MKRGKSEQETLRLNGWGVGTLLAGSEGYGETVIEITYLLRDGRGILAETVSHKGEPSKRRREAHWTLNCRDWHEVSPTPPHNPVPTRAELTAEQED